MDSNHSIEDLEYTLYPKLKYFFDEIEIHTLKHYQKKKTKLKVLKL
jgi:hypothetical protein